MLSYKEFREVVLESTIDNWTHKLVYGDLTSEMKNQVADKYQKSINKPATGDKYQYHFNITPPPDNYNGSLPYGIYSHRSIRDRNDFSSGKLSDKSTHFRDSK